MSAGGVTAEEMEQAIENARTAVLRDPPWAPNARAFLAILTERDQLNAEVADLRRQLEERGDVVTVPQRFVDWCEKHPSSRIYDHCEIIAIARIMDEIHADAKRTLRSGEATAQRGEEAK